MILGELHVLVYPSQKHNFELNYVILLQPSVKQLPSNRTHSATLPRSEPLPTTTTGHYTICCKKPQSCAPEDGQKFARNMLS